MKDSRQRRASEGPHEREPRHSPRLLFCGVDYEVSIENSFIPRSIKRDHFETRAKSDDYSSRCFFNPLHVAYVMSEITVPRSHEQVSTLSRTITFTLFIPSYTHALRSSNLSD